MCLYRQRRFRQCGHVNEPVLYSECETHKRPVAMRALSLGCRKETDTYTIDGICPDCNRSAAITYGRADTYEQPKPQGRAEALAEGYSREIHDEQVHPAFRSEEERFDIFSEPWSVPPTTRANVGSDSRQAQPPSRKAVPEPVPGSPAWNQDRDCGNCGSCEMCRYMGYKLPGQDGKDSRPKGLNRTVSLVSSRPSRSSRGATTPQSPVFRDLNDNARTLLLGRSASNKKRF